MDILYPHPIRRTCDELYTGYGEVRRREKMNYKDMFIFLATVSGFVTIFGSLVVGVITENDKLMFTIALVALGCLVVFGSLAAGLN